MKLITLTSHWANGHVMQFHDGNIWRHSTIITGETTTPTSRHALVTGRTAVGWFNDHDAAADIHPGKSKRVIMNLTNYQ